MESYAPFYSYHLLNIPGVSPKHTSSSSLILRLGGQLCQVPSYDSFTSFWSLEKSFDFYFINFEPMAALFNMNLSH